jgi:hypothetical protein
MKVVIDVAVTFTLYDYIMRGIEIVYPTKHWSIIFEFIYQFRDNKYLNNTFYLFKLYYQLIVLKLIFVKLMNPI